MATAQSTDATDELTVDTDFEGGSARVLQIDQEQSIIRIMPGGDPARGWPAWWYLHVKGLTKGQLLHLSVVGSDRVLPQGRPGAGKPLSGSWSRPGRATWSADGKTWQHTARGERSEAETTYDITSPGEEIWIAWGPPATTGMMNQWMDVIAEKHDSVSTFDLAKTREGRGVRGIRIGDETDNKEPRPVIWLQARQHAWESGSSWVARGIGEWLVGDSENAEWVRKHTVTYIVPIMDIDRVATGDGGKESIPQDHNRDWSDQPHYPEIAATQRRLTAWSKQGRVVIFVDLHNPGPDNGNAFFYVAPNEAIEAARRPRRDRFLDIVHDTYDGKIKLTRKTRSTGPSYHPLWDQISSTWVTQNCNETAIAVCLETPWNIAHSTTEGYESVGAGLTKGIAAFLMSEAEREKPAK